MTNLAPEHYCPKCYMAFVSYHWLWDEKIYALWCINWHRWTLPADCWEKLGVG